MRHHNTIRQHQPLKWAFTLLLAVLFCTGLFKVQAMAVYPTNYNMMETESYFKKVKLRFEPGQKIDFAAYGLDVNIIRIIDTLSDKDHSGTSSYLYIADNQFTVPDYTGKGESFACWKADFSEAKSGLAKRMVTFTSMERETSYPILYLDEQGKAGTFENSILNPDCYYEGEGVGILWNPIKAGFRFQGWFFDQAFTKPFEGIDKDSWGEVTLYANFVKDDHQMPVIYELDGGTSSPFNPVYANDGIKHYLFPAYKPGYIFAGWCQTPVKDSQESYVYGAANASPIVYAKFEPSTDIVPMPSNDPDIRNYTDNQSVRYNGKGYKLPDATKAGYAFLGWYTDPSLSPESRIRKIEAGSSGAYVIYPDFAKSDYKIMYENCEDPCDNPTSFATDRELILSPGKKEGAKFEGWYAEETFETPVTSIKAGQTEDVTLYGKFTDYDYRISYVFYPETEASAMSEIDISDYPTGYDEGVGIPSLAPAAVNQPKLFEFDGWYTENGGNYTKVTSIPKDCKGDMVLYPRVVRRVYNINFELGGGRLDPADAPTTIRSDGSDPNGPVGVKMTAPKAVKDGYKFEHWTTARGSGTTSYLPPITSDFTYCAGYLLTRKNMYVFEPGDEPEGSTGSGYMLSRSYTKAMITFSDAKLEGYDFAGYYEDEACTKRITWVETDWENYTVYVKFVKPKYKIDYVLPEGVEVTDQHPKMYHPLTGTKKLENPTFTDKNLVFDGWYLDPGYTVRIDAIPAYTEGDITVYGKFHRRKTTVYFEHSALYSIAPSFKGTVCMPDPITVETGSEDVILPDAYAQQHIFCGWFKNHKTMQEEDRIYSVPKESQVADTGITVYGAFAEIDSTISYETDGGENSTNNPVTYASKLGVDSFGPALKPGYLFTGWKDKLYNYDVANIPANNGRWNKTLYATYEKTKYAITYHLNGGYITADNPNGYNDGNDAITLVPAERWGSEFLGWFTDPGYDESTKITQIPANSTKDYELYAKFKAVIDPVSYEPAGITHNNPAKYEEGIGVPALSDAGFHGMTFEGWYADPHFRQKITAILPSETGEKTLYAQFSGKITYVFKKGENNVRNPETFLYGRGAALYPASLSGCTFAGWYLDGDVNKKVDYISSKQTGNLVLYAGFLDADGNLIMEKPKTPDPQTPDPGTGQGQGQGQVNVPTGTEPFVTTALPKKKGTRIKDAKKEYEYIVTDDNPAHPKVSFYRCLKKKKKTVKIKTTFTKDKVKYAVTGVSAKAFKNCKKLKKVTIPKSIKKLGKQMFTGCKALRTIEIKTTKLTKKTIAKKAFTGVPKQAKVKVPSKKKKAYNKLFHKKGLSKQVKVK